MVHVCLICKIQKISMIFQLAEGIQIVKFLTVKYIYLFKLRSNIMWHDDDMSALAEDYDIFGCL